MLAASGNEVIGTDKDKSVIDSLNRNELTFSEDELFTEEREGLFISVCESE